MHHKISSILALDVGTKRIGVAMASSGARIAHPLTTLEQGTDILQQLQELVTAEHVHTVVVGLPRGLDGQHTAQTAIVEEFAAELKRALGIELRWQDEAVTSRQAEEELKGRGKPYAKGDIDALSATYILEDFLRDHPELLS
jgi:putative holliday junction resolvase